MNRFHFTKALKRFSMALVLCISVTFGAFAQNSKGITLKMENASLEKVMDAIENQSQYLS